MLTCCPACRTCFRITEAQLAMAQGKVRCGKCKTVFNARQHLQPVPGQSPSASPNAPQSAPTAPADDQPDSTDRLRTPQSEARPPGSTSDETAPAGTSPQATDTPPEPEPSDTTASEIDADTDAVLSADLSGPPTEGPFETDEMPAASAFEQEPPVDAESETEPTVEIPVPDLDEGETDSVTGSSVDTGSVNEAAESEAEPTGPDSRYKYNDFTDEIFSQQELDDILAEMDQQLSLGIDSPGPELSDSLAMPEGPRPPTDENDDELAEAADILFDDLRHEQAPGDQPPEIDDATEETPEQAADQSVRDSEDAPSPDASQSEHLSEDRDSVDAAPTPADPDEAVPLRLRDSLAIQPPKRRGWLATLGGSLLILLLLVLLAGQLILFRPLDVYRIVPQSKPYIEQLCQQLPCQFNARRDPAQIRLINRDVRAHPEQPDALLITAALVNQADYQQAYPDLRVTLFDLSGNRVARRRFAPDDYLGSGYSPFMLMEPGTPLHIKLEVVDPGSDAVNFEFDFQ